MYIALGHCLDVPVCRSLIGGLADTLCGSPLYMAPEIIQNQKYDEKVIEYETDIADNVAGISALFIHL